MAAGKKGAASLRTGAIKASLERHVTLVEGWLFNNKTNESKNPYRKFKINTCIPITFYYAGRVAEETIYARLEFVNSQHTSKVN